MAADDTYLDDAYDEGLDHAHAGEIVEWYAKRPVTVSTAAATGLTFDGFTDRDRAAVEQRTVHGLHGRGALVVGFHFEEREAAAAAGLAIRDYFR